MRTRALIVAALLLVGCSLRRRAPVPEPARVPARDSLFDLDQTRADSVARHGPVEGTLSMLAPDVVYLRAGVPAVYGREAARAVLAALPSAIPPGTSWQPLGGGVSYDLRAAYTYGIAGRIPPPGSATAPRIRFERYIAFWQRTRGQPWRIAAYAEINGPASPEVALSADRTTPPRPTLTKQVADAAAAVRAADSLFADLGDRMGVAYAFSNTVAPMGAVFGSTRLVVGPDAIREFFESRSPGSSLTWKPVYAAVAGSLDLGFTIGESVTTERGASGAALQRFGKYLTVWQRQKDGTWRFVVDGGNATK